ncbi:MAG: hypothetical protein WC841_02715 [Candidatus Shapirobacteria bacterium]|jgi:hypothetical protein
MPETNSNKNKYVKVPTAGVIFFSLLLAGASFYSGISWAKSKGATPDTTTKTTSDNVFAVDKTDRPELKFFVMSFCPYGNQIEDILRPVADLLGDKADIRPQYIFGKVANLGDYCKQRSGDPSQCSSYVTSGYFKTEAECKTTIAANAKTCLDEKNYIKASDGTFYDSLHGRIEANQDIREICAWNQTQDKKLWWNFVDNVNKSCTSENADTCWEEQAKKAGFDTSKITECFNKEAISLIEKEVAETTKYQVSGSPTVLVNGSLFPPEAAYAQDGNGTLKIGDKVAEQAKYRTPNVIKQAVCSAFKKEPKECDTVLNELSGQAPAAGGCN